jgi:hypothetical protein
VEDDKLLFEALNVNDDLQKVIYRFEEMHASATRVSNSSFEPALTPVGVADEEEEEEKDVLMRKNGVTRSSSVKESGTMPLSTAIDHDSKCEEAAMADFDALVFGSSSAPFHENQQDAIKKTKVKDLIDL